MKNIVKTALIIFAVVLSIILIYVAYVFISYSRIDDNQILTADVVGTAGNDVAEVGQPYTILSYNIGFGAYTSDYSFFMDGGKSSWAASEEKLNNNLADIGSCISSYDADIVLLQEVDTDGTRTYHVNEYEYLQGMMGPGSYIFSQNYHSAFLMYPLTEPHGANNSGLVTYISSFAFNDAIRRSLPISTSVSKIVDLDRCYSITRIPVSNGKYLAIYNVHLSAYTNDASVRENQLKMLFEDMQKDYEAGNYIICGGDYNHNLRDVVTGNVPGWASRFPRETLPAFMQFGFDVCDDIDIEHDSCRNADSPYDPATAFTVMVDGFIVSDNITVISYYNENYAYAYSDHDPVVMVFVLN